ncbi:uncharacterized oxidoreductase YjmC-like [Periplaneta americana]|uniref:uncharacterized oxidoreductase YjmC-like n=1 Tax=Periplaneta americana TaxID=6978 RepID=UPI0037E80CEB
MSNTNLITNPHASRPSSQSVDEDDVNVSQPSGSDMKSKIDEKSKEKPTSSKLPEGSVKCSEKSNYSIAKESNESMLNNLQDVTWSWKFLRDVPSHMSPACQDVSTISRTASCSRNESVSSRYSDDTDSSMPADFMNVLRTVKKSDVYSFIKECLKAVHVNENYAELISEVFVHDDCRNKYTTALIYSDMYVQHTIGKICEPNAEPEIVREFGSTAFVNGSKGLGPVVGKFCMELAIQKAKLLGVGIVVANNSNFIGDPSWYSKLAISEGMLGFTFSNSPPQLCPTRSKDVALGANRFCVAAPGESDSLLFSMSNLGLSLGQLLLCLHNREVINLPENCAIDSAGHVIKDPEKAFHTRLMLPLGGVEQTGGYKGYGLSLMVDTLCGILGDSSYGPHIKRTDGEFCGISKNLAQCFIAIDPSCFSGGFEGRMSQLINIMKSLTPVDESEPVLVPDDKEKANDSLVQERDELVYNHININAAYLLSKTFHLQHIISFSKNFPESL